MNYIVIKKFCILWFTMIVSVLLIMFYSERNALASRLNLAIEEGKVNLSAVDAPIQEILNTIILETGMQIFIIGDIENDKFSGTIDNVELDNALRILLKHHDHAIILSGSAASDRHSPRLLVMQDPGGNKTINRHAQKMSKSGQQIGVRNGNKHRASKSKETKAIADYRNNAKSQSVGSETQEALSNRAIETAMITQGTEPENTGTPFDAAPDRHDFDDNYDSDSGDTASDKLKKREEWLVKMIEMTQKNIDSGYADRRYELDVAECGENNVAHASEYLRYYQEQLDELRYQL